jgi:methyltransferase
MIAGMFGAVVFAAMLAEAALAARHDRALRRLGAVEPADDVYAAMQVAYPAAFLGMLAEGAWRGAVSGPFLGAGLGVFAAAKALKYWAIGTLGPRWTFRVLVPPGSTPTQRGPYRLLRHPKYVAVVGELAGCALAMRAVASGPIAVAGFGWLLLRRIRIEEAALAGASRDKMSALPR